MKCGEDTIGCTRTVRKLTLHALLFSSFYMFILIFLHSYIILYIFSD